MRWALPVGELYVNDVGRGAELKLEPPTYVMEPQTVPVGDVFVMVGRCTGFETHKIPCI